MKSVQDVSTHRSLDHVISKRQLAIPSLLQRSKGRLYIRRRFAGNYPMNSNHIFQSQQYHKRSFRTNDVIINNDKDDGINDNTNDNSTVTTWSDSTIPSETRLVAPVYKALSSIENNIHEYRPPSYSHSDSFTFKSLASKMTDSRSVCDTEERGDTLVSMPTLESEDGVGSDYSGDDNTLTFDKYTIPYEDYDDDENDIGDESPICSVAAFTRDYGCYEELCEKIGFQTVFPSSSLQPPQSTYFSDSSRSIIPMTRRDIWDRHDGNWDLNPGNWDDEVVPVGIPDAPSYIDLVNGRGRNIFLGMLIECMEQATVPGFSAIAGHSDLKSEMDHIMSTTSIVLREILGVNLCSTTRSARLTKALESRKCKSVIHNKELWESQCSDREQATAEDSALFNVTMAARQSRLFKVLHRGRGNSDKPSSTHCDRPTGSPNLHLTSRANVMKHRIARVTRILKSRHYVSEEERIQNETKLLFFRIALTAILFRFVSRKQRCLTWVNGTVVRIDISTRNFSLNSFVDILWWMVRTFQENGWFDVECFERRRLKIEFYGTDRDYVLDDHESDGQIDEFSDYVPPAFILDFIKKVNELTDMTPDYIIAHLTPSNDIAGDDDGMLEELMNLRRIEEELSRDMLHTSRCYFDDSQSSTEQFPQDYPNILPPVSFENMASAAAMERVYRGLFAMSLHGSSDEQHDSRTAAEVESAFDVEETKKAVLEAVERIQGKLPPSDHILAERLPKVQEKMMNDLMLLSRSSSRQSTRNEPSESHGYCIESEPETALSSITFGASGDPSDENDDSIEWLKESLSLRELDSDDEYPSLMNFSTSSDSFEGSIIMDLIPSLMDGDSMDDSDVIYAQAAPRDCYLPEPHTASDWSIHQHHSHDRHIRRRGKRTVWCSLLEGHPKRQSERQCNKNTFFLQPNNLNSAAYSAFQKFDRQDNVLWSARLQDEACLDPIVDPERKLAIERAFKGSLGISRGERVGILMNISSEECTHEKEPVDVYLSNAAVDRYEIPVSDEDDSSAPISELHLGSVSQEFSELEFSRGGFSNAMRYLDANRPDPPTNNTRHNPPSIYGSDIEAQSEVCSFQVIRSMESSVTEFVDQLKTNTHLQTSKQLHSPVWSLSPIINTFSIDSGGVSDPDWSLSPVLSPLGTRGYIECQTTARDTKPSKDYNESETARSFTVPSSYQAVLQSVANRTKKSSPMSCNGPEEGGEEYQKSGLAQLSTYWHGLLSTRHHSESPRECRDDYNDRKSKNRSETKWTDTRFVEYRFGEIETNEEWTGGGHSDVLVADPSGHYCYEEVTVNESSLPHAHENETVAICGTPRFRAAECPDAAHSDGFRSEDGNDQVYDPFEAATKIPEAFSGRIVDTDDPTQHSLIYVDETKRMGAEEDVGIEAFILPDRRTMNGPETNRINAISDISGSTDAIYSDSESTPWTVSVASSSEGMEVSEVTSMSTSFPISAVDVTPPKVSDDSYHPLKFRSEGKTSPIPERGLFRTIGDLLFSNWHSTQSKQFQAKRNDIRNAEARLQGIKLY